MKELYHLKSMVAWNRRLTNRLCRYAANRDDLELLSECRLGLRRLNARIAVPMFERKERMSSNNLPELTDEEIETVRVYIATTKPIMVSDEVRAVVERYLPELIRPL